MKACDAPDPAGADGARDAAGDLAVRLAAVRAAVAAAVSGAGRPAGAVRMVAVSKTHGGERVAAVIRAGQLVFGENRVQEAAGKFPPLRAGNPRLRLHLIGPLQTNKVREAVRIADVIESLDRPRLADALADAFEHAGRTTELLVQVNTGREPQKAGVLPEAADRFIASCRARFGDALRGLMCVPPVHSDPVPHFRTLAALAARHGLVELSMGMSADFAEAIACGSTEVRIGSAIFGARPTPAA